MRPAKDRTAPEQAADAERHADLMARTATGLRWSTLATIGLAGSTLGYTALISRLIDPFAFGLLAMANLVVLFTNFFARMGLAEAIIQSPDLSHEEIGAASTVGIAAGVGCFAIVWVAAPALGGLFSEPALPPVLRAMSSSFLFVGVSMTGQGLLRRELRFRELAIIRLGTYVLGFLVVGIGLALLGAGVWSLVAAVVASAAAQAVWQYGRLRHPMRPPATLEPYRALFGYGVRSSGIRLLEYVGSNLDTLAVARVAATALVGQYNRAFYLVTQPLTQHLAGTLTLVFFPSLSRVQDDVPRLRRAYLSVLGLGGVVLFPICAGMAVAAHELVRVVLGPQWGVAAGIVPWIALAGGFNVISKFSSLLTEARAELNKALLLQGSYLVVLAALLIAALRFRPGTSVWVFGAALAVGEILRHLAYLGVVRRLVHASAADLWLAHAPAAFCSAGVALAVALARAMTMAQLPVLAVLAVEIVAAACALAVCIRFCPVPELRRQFWSRLSAAKAAGEPGGLRWRLISLVLGPVEAAPTLPVV